LVITPMKNAWSSAWIIPSEILVKSPCAWMIAARKLISRTRPTTRNGTLIAMCRVPPASPHGARSARRPKRTATMTMPMTWRSVASPWNGAMFIPTPMARSRPPRNRMTAWATPARLRRPAPLRCHSAIPAATRTR
jgi:hypothetical protein